MSMSKMAASPGESSPKRRPRSLRITVGLEGLAMGGCPINALDLARAMRDRGHHLDVFAVDEDVRVSVLPYAERSGFRVTVLPSEATTRQRARQIRDFADQHRSDVVHVYAPWLGPPAAIAASTRPRRAVVVTNWTMENAVRTGSRHPLVVGTRELQVDAQRRHRRRVWLLEPPVDLSSDRPSPQLARDFRRRWGIDADEVVLVVVSRLDQVMKSEGIGYAMRCIEALRAPQVRLVVVGDGTAYEALSALARDVNARLGRPAVLLTGAMLDPRPAYAAADIVLGMGGSGLRALAHAKPLVVLGEAGFALPFTPGTKAYFYDAGFFGTGCDGDPVAHLASVVTGLLAPDVRESLGRFGLDEVTQRFGLEAAATTLEGIYREALSTPTPPFVRWTDATQLLARSHLQHALLPVRRRVARRP